MSRLFLRRVVPGVLVCVALLFLVVDFGERGEGERGMEFVSSEGLVFGTVYHVTYSSPGGERLDGVIRRAMEGVDVSLSMFNPRSTIAGVNEGRVVVADDSLFVEVCEAGWEVSRATGGAFDMTVAPLVDLWGFGLKNRRVVRAAEVDSALACVGYEKVVMEGGVLRKLVPCVRIDAGAIAKGAACDVVLDSLRAHGCRDVCVEIGGEVAVWGVNRRGKEWRIGVNRPVEDSLSVVNEIEVVATLESGRGMATSGNYRNYYEMGGRKFSHTIDPKSGYPVRHSMLSATVVAPDCMTADAWATACMVAGLDSARRWVSERAELEAYLIYDSAGVMRSWYSAGFPKCD